MGAQADRPERQKEEGNGLARQTARVARDGLAHGNLRGKTLGQPERAGAGTLRFAAGRGKSGSLQLPFRAEGGSGELAEEPGFLPALGVREEGAPDGYEKDARGQPEHDDQLKF